MDLRIGLRPGREEVLGVLGKEPSGGGTMGRGPGSNLLVCLWGRDGVEEGRGNKMAQDGASAC